jgi:hypothetical protein
VLAAAVGLVPCGSGADVATGRSNEVAERGPRDHDSVLSIPQISQAVSAAFRQAAWSPASGADVAACARRSAIRVLNAATTSATPLGRFTGPGLLFGRHGEQRTARQ